jgi:hypothetical protein
MSAKRSQRVNSSHDLECEDIVSQINLLVKKIKCGTATVKELQICEKLTDALQNVLKSFSDIDAFDRWVAKETIEMSRYTCKKYGSAPANDKI